MAEGTRARTGPGAPASSSDIKKAIDNSNSKHEETKAEAEKMENMESFPWMTEFRDLTQSTFSKKGPPLIELIKWFNRNVSSNLNDCYKKSSGATKLKELIKEALLLFTYFHRFAQVQEQTRAHYLELMSDLLAMYVDLELVASQREPPHSGIAARLVSRLLVYLESSAEHVLDTLLKVKLVNVEHSYILDAVIAKVFKIIPPHPETGLMYVRYLLVFRLWRKCQTDQAARKRVDDSAITALRDSRPADLPATLLDQMLSTSTQLGNASTKFYLSQEFDLRQACDRFLKHCVESREKKESSSTKSSTNAPENIKERDQRLKSTNTSETIKVNSVNIEFSKSSNSVNKSNSINIPFAKLEIDSNKRESSSTIVSDNNSNNNDVKKNESPRLSKPIQKKKPKPNADIDFIDLTGEVVKIVRKRRKLTWLANAKNLRIRMSAASLKIEKQSPEDSSGRLQDKVKQVKLELAKLMSSPTISPELECKSLKEILRIEENEFSQSRIKEEKPNSSPQKVARTVENSSVEVINADDTSVLEDDSTKLATSTIATPSKALRLEVDEKEEKKISALCSVEDKQSTEVSSSTEEMNEVSPLKNKESLTDNCSAINEPVPASNAPVVEEAVVESNSIEEDRLVNSNSMKTDYFPNKQKVQETLIIKRSNISDIDESQTENVEKNPKDKKNKTVNNDESKMKPSLHSSDIIKSDVVNKELKSTDVSPFNRFFDIQESVDNIDGLTLLASVSAQQVLECKKNELKVKPYSSLQKSKDQEVNANGSNVTINHVIGMYPGNTLDKVALQVEVSTADLCPNDAIKFNHQQQQQESSEMLSYVLDETMQNHLENNDNANVILNGETVMLLQKSPNSNLYIINKAAVDNFTSSKLNYNSDDEDNKLIEPEDTKSGLIQVKHELDDSLRRVPIKSDPGYADLKVGLGHDESKPAGTYELSYGTYPVPPSNSYCTYPNIHHPSPSCSCPNCVYYRQLQQYYLPAVVAPPATTHAIQSVQTTHPTVQETKASKNSNKETMMSKLYDDQLLKDVEKQHPQQQQAHVIVTQEEEVVSRFEHVDSKLPLKKRLKAQRMMSSINHFTDQNHHHQASVNTTQDISVAYPGTLMMSIADMEIQSEHPPHELGAIVEVTSAGVKSSRNQRSSGRKDKKNAVNNNKTMNYNLPNCFPRKSSSSNSGSQKKRQASANERSDTNGTLAVSPAKKPRKSPSSVSNNGVNKQTRSSKRVVPTVNYVYPELDADCNPSGKRKKKRSNTAGRWSLT